VHIDKAFCVAEPTGKSDHYWQPFDSFSVLPTVLRFREGGAIYGVILAAA